MLLTRRPRAIALAGALALLVAACGGDDAAPEPEPVAEAEEVADTAEIEEPVDEPDAAEPEPAADAGAWCAEAVGMPALLDAGDLDDDDVPLDEAIAEMQVAISALERMTAVAPPEIRAETALAVEFFGIILEVTESVHRAGGDEDDVDAALWDDERISEDQLTALDAMFSYLAANC